MSPGAAIAIVVSARRTLRLPTMPVQSFATSRASASRASPMYLVGVKRYGNRAMAGPRAWSSTTVASNLL